MAAISVSVTDDEVDGRPGVRVECDECENVQSCRGASQRSVRRALVMLRDSCPEGASNFYYDPDIETRDP
jgi:arginyl-tRNA--protein-N-Asp/Glu arginylyltransferase